MPKLLHGLVFVWSLNAYALEPVSDADIDQTWLNHQLHNISVTDTEFDCLARNLWHEARHEPVEGQVAVLQVVLNRTQHENYPNSICGVVYQKTRQTCQFSWTCQQPRQPKTLEITWLRTQQLVREFLQGHYRQYQEKYRETLNYHAYYVNPRWNLKPLQRVGAHIFYWPPK